MKILNLYAGIGGNRKLWGNEHKITAVEINLDIAKIYKSNFPIDNVIVQDAHEFLINHFEDYDFIWSSPPCPSHSHIRKELAVFSGQNKPIYPDMKLYEEIILLENFFKGVYIIENVISYYFPLIKPYEIGHHYFWSNVPLNNIKDVKSRNHMGTIEELQNRKGFCLDDVKNIDKRYVLRNCVEPELGLHIFKNVFKLKQKCMNDYYE